MKKIIAFMLCVICACPMICGCNKNKTLLDKNHPVTLSLWHVYGEQADSPINRLIEEFNSTTGKERGVIINVTFMTDAVNVGKELVSSKNNQPGSLPMPDIFFCHKGNAIELGVDNLVNFNDHFTNDELNQYVPEFLDDGKVDDKIVVFPVSKSTHLLFINGTQFNLFSNATGVTYDDLATWDGFFTACEKYYDWSEGKPFCAIDYLMRQIELNTMKYDTNFTTDDGWFDLNNLNFKNNYKYFTEKIVKGYVVISDKFFNTQIMTGEVVSGIGSSAAILYCNDTVTYPDNTTEDADLMVLPLPQTENKTSYVTQAGVGLCSYKTTPQKEEAAGLFAKWLTDSERNLNFVTDTGYMPVHKGAYLRIPSYTFKNQSYERLYDALLYTQANATAVCEQQTPSYYMGISKLYTALREKQKNYSTRIKNGETVKSLVDESYDILSSIR